MGKLKKECVDCGDEKPLKEFGINKNSKDKHQNFCKACGVKKTTKYKENNKTYCGLRNDITGFGAGKATSTKSNNEFWIEG